MSIIEVTRDVEFGNSDDEYLPITKCVCGEKFTLWDFSIGIYDDMVDECPKCGAKLFFTNHIQVFQIVEG